MDLKIHRALLRFIEIGWVATILGTAKAEEPSKKSEEYARLKLERSVSLSLLQPLIAHFIHQDNLLWQRLGLAVLVQTAGLGAAYTTADGWGGWFGFGVLILVFLGTRSLLIISRRDRECRNANLHLLRKIEEAVLDDDAWIADKEDVFPQRIRVGTSTTREKGGELLRIALGMLMIIDIVLAILAPFGKFPPASQPPSMCHPLPSANGPLLSPDHPLPSPDGLLPSPDDPLPSPNNSATPPEGSGTSPDGLLATPDD